MKWPPNSPDMNPIEHFWQVLKTKLHSKYPDTRVLPGGPEKVREVLEERLKEVWLEIGPSVLKGLIQSMPS
jgi:transposase